MSRAVDRGLLSIGAFLVILVIAFVLYSLPLHIGLWLVPALVIAMFGCWVLILAGMQASNPQKYEWGAFSLFGWGLLLIAVGGAWFLWNVNWLYSIVLLLLVVGAIAIAAALRRK